MIELKNVTKNYGEVNVLKSISTVFEARKQYVIEGASGSGKSSLLYLIGGLDQPTQGDVFYKNTNLSDLTDETAASYRNSEVGFVFQFHFLLSTLTALKNILLPCEIGNHNRKEVKEKCEFLCEQLKITHCLNKYPYELSGGEHQRVSIVRALSLGPKILLCDEPTGNLDSQNSEIVVSLLVELSKELGSMLLLVTHDKNISAAFQNKIYIENGKLS